MKCPSSESLIVLLIMASTPWEIIAREAEDGVQPIELQDALERDELGDLIEKTRNHKARAQIGYFSTIFLSARIYDRADKVQNGKRVRLLKQLLTKDGPSSLPTFVKEHEGQYLGLWGSLLLGLVHHDLGDYGRAIEAFERVCRAEPSDLCNELRQKAFYRKAIAQLRAGAYGDARRTVDCLFDEYAIFGIGQELGLAARLVKATSYVAEGRKQGEDGHAELMQRSYQSAIGLAGYVAAWDGQVADRANSLIVQWLRVCPIPLGPNEHFAVAEDEFGKRGYVEARREYEQVLEFEGVADKRRAECLFKIGLCYHSERKLYRAGLAFLGVFERLTAPPRLCHESMKWARRAFREQWKESQNDFDYELVKMTSMPVHD